jgi:uncharacterized protein
MTDVDRHPPGAFCWYELATTDQNGAKKFYAELLGWTPNDVPVGPNDVYSLMRLRDRDAAALFTQRKEERAAGILPHWQCYVAVDNADEAVAKVKALGGEAMTDAFDVMDAGRMAYVRDPAGATFSLWQPKQNPGIGVVNEPGAACWTELYSPDTARTEAFYTALFGWTADHQDMGGMTYTMFRDGDRQAAGMLGIAEEWVGMPPAWLVYFGVADCDAAVKKARKLGGKLLSGPTDVPRVGRFATLQDPQGAGFAVIAMVG